MIVDNPTATGEGEYSDSTLPLEDETTNATNDPMNPLCKPDLHTPSLESIPLHNHVQMILLLLYGIGEGEERERRVCKSLLHMAASDCGSEILIYLIKMGAVSNLEISKELGLDRQIIAHHLRTLENLGILKVFTTIQNEPRLPAEYRNAKIRGWVGLPAEYSQRAVQRYLAYFRKDQPVKPKIKDPKTEERDYNAILSKAKAQHNEITRTESLFILKQYYPDPLERSRALNSIKPQLQKQGIKYWV
jgi:DNA-binding Lrp family transcriptional regulator